MSFFAHDYVTSVVVILTFCHRFPTYRCCRAIAKITRHLLLQTSTSCAPYVPLAATVLETGSAALRSMVASHLTLVLMAALLLTLRATWLCQMAITIASKCFGTVTVCSCAQLAARDQRTASLVTLGVLRLMPMGTLLYPKTPVIVCKF